MRTTATPKQILNQVFGLESFRPGQKKVIDCVLGGRSALALFPTGGGKSLCYQLPALLSSGLTLVVSPLIALMKDQVDYLKGRGVKAARFDSSLSLEEASLVKNSVKNGSLKILFVSPEKLSNERFRNFMRGTLISLIAIDEAHCVSQWGHNFRPDYLKLARYSNMLNAKKILALTATATPQVVSDICDTFGIEANDATITGFNRPNLNVFFTEVASESRFDYLSSKINETSGQPTIVYVTLQNTAETVAEKLVDQGFKASAYHAGMKSEVRENIQNDFMDGRVDVIVATIAFGMGIDKSDIRFVFHYNLPKSLESYMQEIGRAGRDGNESYCEVLANGDDVTTLLNFTYGDTPGIESLTGFFEMIALQDTEFSLNLRAVSSDFDIRPLVLSTIFTYLELDNHLEFLGIEYETFQWKWLVDRQNILSRFDSSRAQFLEAVFNCGKMGRSIFTLEIENAMKVTGENRERISIALSYLRDKNMIDLRLKNQRHRYRMGREPIDLRSICARYQKNFIDREEQDEKRMKAILDLPTADCIMREITKYFGENIEPCGKCSSCLNGPSKSIPVYKQLLEDPIVLSGLTEKHNESIPGARSLARFSCGLTSPKISKLKLNKHEDFGSLANFPFKHILSALESIPQHTQ